MLMLLLVAAQQVRSTLARYAAAAGAGLLELTLELEHLVGGERARACSEAALCQAQPSARCAPPWSTLVRRRVLLHCPPPPLALQSDPDALLAAFKSAITAGGRRLRLVVLDHVVSFPPVLLPVQQICELCRCAQQVVASCAARCDQLLRAGRACDSQLNARAGGMRAPPMQPPHRTAPHAGLLACPR